MRVQYYSCYVRVGHRSKDGRTVEPRRRPSSTSISFYVEIDSVSVSDILMTVDISAICIILCSDNYNQISCGFR